MRTRARVVRAVGAVVALGVLLTACSSAASTRAGDDGKTPTTTAKQVSLPETVPAGTELRVGDQLD